MTSTVGIGTTGEIPIDFLKEFQTIRREMREDILYARDELQHTVRDFHRARVDPRDPRLYSMTIDPYGEAARIAQRAMPSTYQYVGPLTIAEVNPIVKEKIKEIIKEPQQPPKSRYDIAKGDS
jgi:hypothetical protein